MKLYVQLEKVGRCEDQNAHSLFVFCATVPQWALASPFTRFLDYAQRRFTVGRTPLDE